MKLTNSMLAEKLDIPISKIRRWTKEFLPPDPIATRRSGYAREFSVNDGFIVFIGGHLVSKLSFSFIQAKEIIKALRPWLEGIGLVPEIPGKAKRRGIDKEITCDYEVEIKPPPVDIEEKWSFVVSGIIDDDFPNVAQTDNIGRAYVTRVTKKVQYWSKENMVSGYWPAGTIKMLPVWELLEDFICSMAGVRRSHFRIDKPISTYGFLKMINCENGINVIASPEDTTDINPGRQAFSNWLKEWEKLKEKD
ncbi:hypothetical protein Dalk_4184 [Desulfatibacillum aliphaticivorans]|uniref:Uncharacterized protein n=1 Tax=Desulfatibacillum aliphaticivorans TaxID=218208 RepID=B8FMZ6_DESAL|nr:hypothetical protein [Desulfatibacillum aliphaticivorans]ACL05866.1 hypothetical protein Dalk_4184 [Desulfatibacillum aliphaticivorans]